MCVLVLLSYVFHGHMRFSAIIVCICLFSFVFQCFYCLYDYLYFNCMCFRDLVNTVYVIYSVK